MILCRRPNRCRVVVTEREGEEEDEVKGEGKKGGGEGY
jgi:hypothetical protein